jgi:hypothetical protein
MSSMSSVGTIDQPTEREFDLELQEAFLQHAGRWVAIVNSKVVAVADGPAEALEAARSEFSEEEVILHRVPEDTNTAYFF